MKKPEAFERKRLTRDKANHRWVKSRHYVAPAFAALYVTGAVLGATASQAISPDAAIAGALVGGGLAVLACGHYIVRKLCE